MTEVRHGHDLPLQPLGLVDGHQLDGIRAGRAGRVQTTLVFLRDTQECQERTDRTVVVQTGEARRDVDERGKVVTAAGRDRLGARRQFHVQTGDLNDPVDDVQQWLVDVGPQIPQLRTEHPQPGPGLGRHLWARVVQHVGERDHVAGVDPEHRLIERIGRQRFARRLVGYQRVGSRLVEGGSTGHPDPDGLTRRAPERREVTAAQPHPRTGDQPREGRVGRRIVQHLQRRDDVGYLRQTQQTAEAHDLHRQFSR